MLTLQNVLLPSAGTCEETELYYRTAAAERQKCTLHGNELAAEKGCTISFDTYFGGFTIEKWRKYTHVRRVSLKLLLKGVFTVRLCCMTRSEDGAVHTQELLSAEASSEGMQEFTYEFPDSCEKGMLCFSLTSMQDGSVFGGGSYFSMLAPEEQRYVKIAVDICTYRREAFIEQNLKKLRSSFLDAPDSFLYDKLEIFISDNAGTLDIPALSSEKIHIVKNKNVGGAGGFTRGLIEIQNVRKERKITHVLLNDDDIVYEPEALFRTCTFLTCIRPEYADAFVGGAMLRLDMPYFQVESGAVWNGGRLVSLKRGLDLRDLEACLYNETEEDPQYNAWWFCAFPAEVASEDNLPMPIFIRGDDVEYGLRNTKHLVLLNGICVRHEPFENKYSSALYYYIFRNRLIDNALHDMNMTAEELKRELYGYVMNEVRLYRYRNARLLMKGMRDFFKGTEWFAQRDGEAIHQQIMQEGYAMKPVSELGEGITFDEQLFEQSRNADQPRDLLHRVIANRTVNGTYLPPKRKYNIVPADGVRQITVYRTETVLNYDAASGRGFVTKRDVKEAKACIAELREMYRRIDTDYEKTVQDYKLHASRFWKRSFWEKYLELTAE
ncbi:MAG: glycosyltransferase [Ruminococcus sp.]|nr:glycosyltransferase [Ruminococcus sp.]